jgi:hypothetical protein
MAAPYNPPVKNEEFICYVALEDLANPGSFKANPTLAAGDVKLSKDGGALANIAEGTGVLTVTPAGSIWVKVVLTATEMNADNVAIQFIDQTAPKEWADLAFNIVTTA